MDLDLRRSNNVKEQWMLLIGEELGKFECGKWKVMGKSSPLNHIDIVEITRYDIEIDKLKGEIEQMKNRIVELEKFKFKTTNLSWVL